MDTLLIVLISFAERLTLINKKHKMTEPHGLTERIWLRAFGTPPKFLALLGTSDALEPSAEIANGAKNNKESIVW